MTRGTQPTPWPPQPGQPWPGPANPPDRGGLDPARIRAVAEAVALDPASVELLVATASGLVARYRRSSSAALADGVDQWLAGAGDARPVAGRMRTLRRAGLVAWQPPAAGRGERDMWPWEPTAFGRAVLVELRGSASTVGSVQ